MTSTTRMERIDRVARVNPIRSAAHDNVGGQSVRYGDAQMRRKMFELQLNRAMNHEERHGSFEPTYDLELHHATQSLFYQDVTALQSLGNLL